MSDAKESNPHSNPDDHRRLASTIKDPNPIKLLFEAGGTPINLQNIYQGCPAFLVAGGPSFQSIDREKLLLPGCLTMAMNNAAKSIRPDLWVCVDDPSQFLRSIWLDPKILKFSPISHARRPIFDSDAWKFLDIVAGDCPNSVFFQRNDRFNHETYLHESTVNWGNHRRHGGGRSVMLAALRLLHHLGVRQVFLLGVDFKMDANHTYHFSQERHRSAIDCNRKTYEMLKERLALLQPLFLEARFEVFNCNPESELSVFPFLDFDEAVSRCRDKMPEDVAAERTEGLYDRRKTGRTKPPAGRRSRLSPPPLLKTPKVARSSRNQQQATLSGSSRGVVVGSDGNSEWLLPWWFENYTRHNDIPVTFVDLGMSADSVQWCCERGKTVPLPRRFPHLPEARLHKPLCFILCHAEKILSIDLDCEIRGSLQPVFELIDKHPVAVRHTANLPELRPVFRNNVFFNTGVLGAPKDHPVILEWGRLTVARHTEFKSVNELFNYTLYQNPKAEIVELAEGYNLMHRNGNEPDAVVVHWTGSSGKQKLAERVRANNSAALHTQPMVTFFMASSVRSTSHRQNPL